MDIIAPKLVYIQTTLYCGMQCRHCCYNCGPHQTGTFMSEGVFEAALNLFPGTYINIGGGEPTCHPKIFEFLALALRANGRGQVWMATNGQNTHRAMIIADMIRLGEIKGCLSLDHWHKPINRAVVDAFLHLKSPYHKKVIRSVDIPIKEGRWKDKDFGRNQCNGDGMAFVQWDGQVRQCACLDSPVIGDVFSGVRPLYNGVETWTCGCHKSPLRESRKPNKSEKKVA